jgi:hypothetical protein
VSRRRAQFDGLRRSGGFTRRRDSSPAKLDACSFFVRRSCAWQRLATGGRLAEGLICGFSGVGARRFRAVATRLFAARAWRLLRFLEEEDPSVSRCL